jgi:hypothetical protein
MRSRVGTLVVRALVVTGVLPVLTFAALGVLVTPGTAHADPCVAVLCPTATADPTPTVTHTAAPTPTRSPTARPTVTSTYSRSPRPRPTPTTAPTTTPSPDPDPTPTTELTTTPAVKPVQKSTTAGPKLAKLAALVVGGALLLGVGGVSGLYLTRTRP